MGELGNNKGRDGGLRMADVTYTEALVALNNRLDGLVEMARVQEETQQLVRDMNGFVREHGQVIAAHEQWITGHELRHEGVDKDQRRLSNRVWALGGGSGILAAVAMLLQAFGK